MSLLSDITDFIASDASIEAAFGASISVGTNLFISFMPDSPDNVIVVTPYGGSSPELNSKYKHNSHVQVSSRASTFSVAYNTCQEIINQIHYNGNVLSNSRGMLYAIQSSPIFLQREEDRRVIVVCNFEAKFIRY